ncbi:hypothetical protein [Psychromonas sp. SP041]|uniref:hypothetical protein n=1 Tax=Psychromonas sp. SP041 TaxID=1365007 RepID=UPI0014851DDC|nr:hypothetical protein [Psychromonas sp. SP041]
MANEVDRPYGFIRKSVKEDGSTSHQVALTQEKSGIGIVSGAAILADGYSNIIFVEKVSAQEVWICAIADSEVLVGGDIVINISNVAIEFEKILDNYKESPPFVYSQSLVESTGVEGLPSPDETLSFDELLLKAEITKIGKEFNSYRIGNTESKSKNTLMAIVILAVIGGGAYSQFGSSLFEKEKEFTPQVDFSKLIHTKVKTTEEILSDAKKEELKWLTEEFNNSNSSQIIRRILAFDIVQEKYINGWKANEISFNSKNPNGINVLWERSQVGTPLSLKLGIKNDKTTVADLTGRYARSEFEAIDKINNELPDDFDLVKFIETATYQHEHMMHDLISMGYMWGMDRIDLGERQEKIKGLDKKLRKQENTRQLKFKTTSVVIQGDNRDKLSALINIFDSAKTFTLNKISISLVKNSFKWKAEGVLYEK